MRESKIEAHLVKQVKTMGGECRKVRWVNRKGAPDRLVMLPGVLLWVELKATGEKAEPHQVREHERMRAMGQQVRCDEAQRNQSMKTDFKTWDRSLLERFAREAADALGVRHPESTHYLLQGAKNFCSNCCTPQGPLHVVPDFDTWPAECLAVFARDFAQGNAKLHAENAKLKAKLAAVDARAEGDQK